jgi:capsular polysaccharide transport system permease protein
MLQDRSPRVVALQNPQSPAEIRTGRAVRPQFWLEKLLRYKSFALLVILPSLITCLYYGWIATDRYVSEAQIVVRRAAEPAPTGGLASFLKTTGLSGGADETSTVQAYILSRDALEALGARLPVRSYFDVAHADFLARWPSWMYGRSNEEFYRYYKTMASAVPSHETGVLTISIEAFEPEAAKRMTTVLLELAEEMVNRLNDRIRTDAIKMANDEVARGEEALVLSQIALTQFRNRELLLDPQRNAILLTELIGKLNTELANTIAQVEQLRQGAPDSPQLAPLTARVSSLQQQIASQRDLVAASGAGLADKVAQYERLTLQQQFATRRLAAAVAGLTVAQNDARRQQIFLQRIVEPNLPDKSTVPRRLVSSITVFGWSLLLYLIFWLVSSGVREHSVAHSG